MNKLGVMAAALALAGPAVALSEPAQPPPLTNDRRRSRLRFGAYTSPRSADQRRLEAYKRQRRANRLRRKALGK